jgi:hypothetical protein
MFFSVFFWVMALLRLLCIPVGALQSESVSLILLTVVFLLYSDILHSGKEDLPWCFGIWLRL